MKRLNYLAYCKQRLRRSGSLRGFTAVEIAMVATVIAIIALLVLPVYRERVHSARIAAANDELASLAKAILLAEADLGIQIRLQDLDNGVQTAALDNTNTDTQPPIAAWNGTLETVVPVNRDVIVERWGGPYAAFKNFRTVNDLADFWYIDTSNDGFIYVVGNGGDGPNYTGNIIDRISFDRYPVDPWGQPYVFYGVGMFPADNGTSNEPTFNSSILVSFGPNGVVSNGLPITSAPGGTYKRYRLPGNPTTGLIGEESTAGDDLIYKF